MQPQYHHEKNRLYYTSDDFTFYQIAYSLFVFSYFHGNHSCPNKDDGYENVN